MKRICLAPILWGFFLSLAALSTSLTPHLKTSLGIKSSSILPPSTAAEKHLNILAIRVQFQPDTLSTTTGNGTFGSGIPDDAIVDPLPHDRLYFEDHLRFLHNYYSDVSKGKVTIDTFAVFPLDTNGAYILTNQMWHYNYNTTQEDLNLRLTWLFQDAWTAAAQQDTNNDIHFDEWDTFVIYHAGIGQDFTVGFDETPHDIPSAYFRIEDLKDALGDPGYQGVLVDTANNIYIQDGLLLPESEHQFEVDVEIALNGTAALLFGQWIGLPALYNTETGASGVGRFDLMDQGSGNFAGMIPSRPCAWSRAFMGWETPQLIVPAAEEVTFGVKQTKSDTSLPEIYRINLNENEYYLIENRSWDPHSMGYTYAYDRDGDTLKIFEDYGISPEVLSGEFGVIVKVDNYDFGLPGEGILIWHVDEDVIEVNYAANTVNNDLSHRGVALVEADGANDIGRQYGFLDVGYGTEYGWSGDFFFQGNPAFLNANAHLNLSTVIFSDDSYPGTRTYDGSPTGLVMGGFSAPDTVMSFWVNNGWLQQGFPRQLAELSGGLSPSALDFDNDGQTDLILTVTPGGAVQAFDNLGVAQGDCVETRFEETIVGDILTITDTLLTRVDTIIETPAVDVYSDGFTAIIPSADGKVYHMEYTLQDSSISYLDSVELFVTSSCIPMIVGSETTRRWYIGDNEGRLYCFDEKDDTVWSSVPFEDEAILGLCLSDTLMFMLTGGGGATLFDDTGNTVWTKRLPFIPTFHPITLFHQKDSRRDLVAVSNGGEIVLLDPSNGEIRPGFPFNVGMSITAPPTAADFDRDGFLEIILIGENRIAGVQLNGVLSANWPLFIDNNRPFDPIVSPPAISELDGELGVLFGWPDGAVGACYNWGNAPAGFTRSTGSTVRSAPILLQLDEGSNAELLALDESGTLYAWNLQGLGDFDTQHRPWNGLYGGNARQGVAIDSVGTVSPDERVLVTSKVYPWPNPANDVVNIRYKMGKGGRITVRIFDGAGDLVKELSSLAQAGLEDDLVWDLADVSSGVYIGRVEAESGGSKERTFIKIAVIK